VPESSAVRRAALAMVIATMLWGATFVVIRDSLHRIRPTTLVATRFALATLVLGAAALATKRRDSWRALYEPGTWRAAFVVGAIGGASYLCQAIGLIQTSAGSSAFLTCSGILTAGLFAWPLLGQRPSPTLLAGLALAASGAALLSPRLDRLLPGDLWTIVGAVGFGLQVVAIARWAPRLDPLALGASQSAVATLVLLPFVGSVRTELAALGGIGWARLGYLVLAGTVVAPMLQIIAQRTLPAGRIGLWSALEPVFALLFALFFGGEHFPMRWWVGAALILFAVSWVESRAMPASSRGAT
jgi:drug/metabolite transporter (DMT)-like permease